MTGNIEKDMDHVREEGASELTLEARDESSVKTTPETLPAEGGKVVQDGSPIEDANTLPKDNALTQTISSQSQKRAKSKLFIIMAALCVCDYPTGIKSWSLKQGTSGTNVLQ